MRLEISPFMPEHLDDAAALLAARHAADRLAEPDLPAKFEQATATREAIRPALEEKGARGVAAYNGSRMVGYLIGLPALFAPTSAMALAVPPYSVRVPYHCHATEPEDRGEIYRAMYAAFSGQWVEAGYFTHYVVVPAKDRAAVEAWFSLGFGQEMAQAVRDTSPLALVGHEKLLDTTVSIRRAQPDDLDDVLRLILRNIAYHAAPPMFAPYLPETVDDLQRIHEEMLADPAVPIWLACKGSDAVGIQTFTAMRESPAAPEKSIYLQNGFTVAEARGSGVATALLRTAIEWARNAGYRRCTVGWLTSNLLSGRFWQHSGFRPLTYRLYRPIDPRILWAKPPANLL